IMGLVAGLGMISWGLASLAPVQDWLVSKGVDRMASQKAFAAPAQDQLQVVICGTSPPPPSKTRAKTCTLILAGDRAFVVDTGPGSANNLSRWRFPMKRLRGVLLTHFHSDHIGDLGEIRMQSWVAGRTAPLPVYGPDGVDQIVAGVNTTYAQDDSYRGPEHDLPVAAANLVARPFGLAGAADRATHMAQRVILNEDGLKITAFQVLHEPVYPAVGYRFDYRGRSVLVSGDTAASANLLRQAKGVDLLIHEGQSEAGRKIMSAALLRAGDAKLAKVISEVGNYHATPVQAAEIARKAGVGMLVFNHMGPIPPDNVITKKLFARGVAAALPDTPWRMADDGLVLTLPIGTRRIDEHHLD
ncbi:MAG: hypothetical protein RJB22_864, partial [Pseudomonadota bacterium]